MYRDTFIVNDDLVVCNLYLVLNPFYKKLQLLIINGHMKVIGNLQMVWYGIRCHRGVGGLMHLFRLDIIEKNLGMQPAIRRRLQPLRKTIRSSCLYN